MDYLMWTNDSRSPDPSAPPVREPSAAIRRIRHIHLSGPKVFSDQDVVVLIGFDRKML
jgi:hypothetical protein